MRHILPADPPKGNLAVELAHATLERVGGPVATYAPDPLVRLRERIARRLGRQEYHLDSERLFVLASPALKRRLLDQADEILADLTAAGVTLVRR